MQLINFKNVSCLIFLCLCLGFFNLGLFGQKSTTIIKGSDTCLPVVQNEAEQYMKKNTGASVSVIGGGSGVGIAALQNGTTDIAMSSRKLKMNEKVNLQKDGKSFKEIIFAYDALSVVVHPSNKVKQLTREQLEDIFTGKIKNWKQVGGDDLKIIVYSRESSSGTYEFFKERVMKSKNFMMGALLIPATGSIIQSIGQTKGGIGYAGLAYVHKEVKSIGVSFDGGKTYILPSQKSVKDKSYPVARPLYFYYLLNSEGKVNPFIKYTLSAEGQNNVLTSGYVPLN